VETVKSAISMTIACALSLALAAAFAPDMAAELFLGMVAPLVVGVATMVAVEQVYRRDPGKLTPLLIKAFGAKMVLFGVYVVAVISLTSLSPTPFVLSFSAYFIGLHLTEALMLRSLLAEPMS
jgi:hypothetical protein